MKAGHGYALIPYGIVAGVLMLWPIATWADGFRNPFQDAAAAGQGTAFIAQANNPSAIHYNPAGMTQLPGLQQAFGVAFISPNTDFRSPSGDKVENDIGPPVGLPPPGQLFVTSSLASLDIPLLRQVWLGLGVESLFGFANKYPKGGPFATTITRSQLPGLGYQTYNGGGSRISGRALGYPSLTTQLQLSMALTKPAPMEGCSHFALMFKAVVFINHECSLSS